MCDVTGCLRIYFSQAWFTVIDAVKRHEDRGEYPLNVAMEMRFVRSSNAYISPAVNNTLSCYMEILSGINTPGFQEFEHGESCHSLDFC